MIGLFEHIGHRAAQLGIAVQGMGQLIGRQGVGQLLRAAPVVNVHEGVIGHGVADTLRRQLARQPAMTIAVELQAERRPGRHAQIDQPELRVLEVEVVVQALAAVPPDEGLVGSFVVPRLVGIAGFHGRDDVHQAGVVATLFKHSCDDIFLADMRLADMLYGHSRLGGQCRRALAHTFTQRLGKFGVVEDADAPGIEISGHPRGVAHHRQRPGDHQPVIA